MTLLEINELCKKYKLPYAYKKFEKPTNPPHLIGTVIDSNNFGADNIVWYKRSNFMLELTTLKKDLKIQNVVENYILKDIFWEKKEDYIETEGVYNTSYFFEIEEE